MLAEKKKAVINNNLGSNIDMFLDASTLQVWNSSWFALLDDNFMSSES